MAEDFSSSQTAPPSHHLGVDESDMPKRAPKARTIYGLAAELKNEIRADQIRQSERQRRMR